MKRIASFVIALLFCLTFSAYGNAMEATDYAAPEHWLSLPAAADKNVLVLSLTF